LLESFYILYCNFKFLFRAFDKFDVKFYKIQIYHLYQSVKFVNVWSKISRTFLIVNIPLYKVIKISRRPPNIIVLFFRKNPPLTSTFKYYCTITYKIISWNRNEKWAHKKNMRKMSAGQHNIQCVCGKIATHIGNYHIIIIVYRFLTEKI